MAIEAYATIVSLIGQFRSERSGSEQAEILEFLTWLEKANYLDLKKQIESNQETSIFIKSRLNTGLDALNEKLDQVLAQPKPNKGVARIIEKILQRVIAIENYLHLGFMGISRITARSVTEISHSLEHYQIHRDKLDELVRVNAVLLNEEWLPLLSDFDEVSDLLKCKMEFVFNIYINHQKPIDYILESPINDLKSLVEISGELKTQSNTNPSKELDIETLERYWRAFVKNNPAFDDLEEYEPTDGREPLFFDVPTMVKMGKPKHFVGRSVRTYMAR